MKEGKNENEILSVIVGMFTVTTDTDGELSRIVHTRSARYYETATPSHADAGRVPISYAAISTD